MPSFSLIRDKMDMGKILALRASQYVQALYIEDIVTAGGTKPTPLPLSSIGAFQVISLTGFYTSLKIKVAGVSLQDLGVCPLRMKISAGASNFEMFGDYVPMNLLLSPGRVRVNPADPQLITGGYTLADADQGPVPGQYLQPYSYLFPFRANDTITVSVKNDFDTAASGWTNRWGICFYGLRVTDIPAALDEVKYRPAKKQ